MGRPRQFNEAEVVSQATALFWAQGYRATTPSDLSAATGLSRSSLYNTFGNKEGLFLRALEAYITAQEAGMRAELDARSLHDALAWMYNKIVTTSVPVADGGQGLSCLMCTATVEARPSEVALLKAVQQGRERMTSVFRDRLSRARDEGELGADKDPGALALFLFNTNTGLVVLARAGTPAETLRVIADQTIRAVLA